MLYTIMKVNLNNTPVFVRANLSNFNNHEESTSKMDNTESWQILGSASDRGSSQRYALASLKVGRALNLDMFACES